MGKYPLLFDGRIYKVNQVPKTIIFAGGKQIKKTFFVDKRVTV